MAIDVAAAAIGIVEDDRRQIDVILKGIARADLAALSSEATRFVAEVKAFARWNEDPRPAYSDSSGCEDKFAELIGIACHHPELTAFFTNEVGVNMSTVWRWSNGKSRPTRYVGSRLSREVSSKLGWLLYDGAIERGLEKMASDGST